MFTCRQKISFILHNFLELRFYCEDIVSLYWVLWECLAIHNKRDTFKLQKTFAFICRKKSTLSSMLWWRFPAFWTITREPEFSQLWDWWWNINNNISFYFRLYPRKTSNKTFQKIPQKLFRCQFWPFLCKFGQKLIFVEERALPVFKYSNYLPSYQKSGKKMSQSWEKNVKLMDGQTDRQTERQQWFYRTLHNIEVVKP